MRHNRFIGTWKLRTFELIDTDGKVSYPYGKDARGYISYNQDGYVQVHIMNNNRPNFASTHFGANPQVEKAAAFDTVVCYCGKYTIQSPKKIIHHIEISTVPNMTNSDQDRFYKFEENCLTLGGTLGKKYNAHLVWERVQ